MCIRDRIYNAKPFLDKCIKSALIQPQTREVILIDDRSTDGSVDLCKEWASKDDRVKFFQNQGVKGAGATRNIGLIHAKYEYIAFLDADDYYLDGRFEGDELILTNEYIVDGTTNLTLLLVSNNEFLNTRLNKYKVNEIFGIKTVQTKIDMEHVLFDSLIHLNSVTIRRKLIDNSCLFDESLIQTQDTDFLLRLVFRHCIISTSNTKPVAIYRIHENGTTTNILKTVFYKRRLNRKYFINHIFDLKINSLCIYFLKSYTYYDFVYLTKDKAYIKNRFFRILILPINLIRLFWK